MDLQEYLDKVAGKIDYEEIKKDNNVLQLKGYKEDYISESDIWDSWELAKQGYFEETGINVTDMVLNIKIIFRNILNTKNAGLYYPGQKRIVMYRGAPNKKKTLVHELIHYIQDQQGYKNEYKPNGKHILKQLKYDKWEREAHKICWGIFGVPEYYENHYSEELKELGML
jgi:hypothetical protein